MSEHNSWNNKLYNKIAEIVPKAGLVFEIGAYDGSDIPIIKGVWQNAVIHAFEPDPGNYALAAKFACPDVVVNQLALSNTVGPVTFYQALDCRCENRQDDRGWWFKTAGSLHKNGAIHLQVQPTLVNSPITVQATTLDTYCGGTLKPEVLLMDTQGCEYEILEGATETLKTVRAVLCEWSKQPIYEGQKLYDDLNALLDRAGFKFHENHLCWQDFHGEGIWIRK